VIFKSQDKLLTELQDFMWN